MAAAAQKEERKDIEYWEKMADEEFDKQTPEQTSVANRLCVMAEEGILDELQKLATTRNCGWRRDDLFRRTPLHYAALSGSSNATATVQHLLSLQASVDSRDWLGSTALHCAALIDNAAAVQVLVAAGAAVNAVDGGGVTPLMEAADWNKAAAAAALLEAGADLTMRDSIGRTAREIAKEFGSKETADLLARGEEEAGKMSQQQRQQEVQQKLRQWRQQYNVADQKQQRATEASAAASRSVGRDEVHSKKPVPQPEASSSSSFSVRKVMKELYGVLVPPPKPKQPQQQPQQQQEQQQQQQQQKEQRQQQQPEPLYYPVTKPQGVCLVINNEFYSKNTQLPDRTGSAADVQQIESLFSELQFEVVVEQNLTAAQMCWCAIQAAQRDHSRFGAFVCFLMAHGTEGAVYGTDGKYQTVDVIASLFASNKCVSLSHKPKIFFVQACRVVAVDEMPRAEMPRHRAEMPRHRAETDFLTHPVTQPVTQATAPGSDFLLCYAKGAFAFRHPDTGSQFVQAVCQFIRRDCKRLDLGKILTRVNAHLSRTPVQVGHLYYPLLAETRTKLLKDVMLHPDLAD